MALTVSYHVQCDGCGVEDRPGEYLETTERAKVALIERGWTFTVDDMAICEDCSAPEATGA